MVEATQADRDAAAAFNNFPTWEGSQRVPDRAARDTYELAQAFARHRKYGYDQGYYDGRQLDGAEERAAIVAWLRSDKIVLSMDGSAEDVVASAIEAGEHLK